MKDQGELKQSGSVRLGQIVVGVVIGFLVTAVVGWAMMPRMMLSVHQSRYPDVEQTCEALKAAIESAGWHCPAVRDMNKSMVAQGVAHEGPVRIVELCQAEYAHDVLKTNPEVATLMPCAYGVYEGADGKVYISGMNVGLMGKMFGGKIAEVMGTKVAHDEEVILRQVIVH